MSRIRIKNFGPIRDGYLDNDGWLDIKKVTVFIGDQGSGKSTVAKLISTFMWMEKAMNRGDLDIRMGADILKIIAWHRLKDYFNFDNQNFEIEFEGDKRKISYSTKNSPPKIDQIESSNYIVPKISYVPAERNFLSSIKNAFVVSGGLPDALASFSEELREAQEYLNGQKIDLPFKRFNYEYDIFSEISYVAGDGYRINLLDASSGLQSIIPLFLVSRHQSMKILWDNDPSIAKISANNSVRRNREISDLLLDNSWSIEEKTKKTEEIFAKYHNKCFINIVEEPEQNLYPASQQAILNSLLEFNNMSMGNKLVMTTHSPYLINYLTLAVKAFKVRETLTTQLKSADEKIKEIVPIASLLNPDDLVIYELNAEKGTITKLEEYKGLPSDENFLNKSLEESNELFAQLQEIEKGWR